MIVAAFPTLPVLFLLREDPMADITFLRLHAWLDQAIPEALKDVAHPNQKTASRKILWSLSTAPLVEHHFNAEKLNGFGCYS